MKSVVIAILFAVLAFGQTPQPPKPAPGTPAPPAPALQPPAPAAPAAPIAPDTVVVEVAGKKYTAAEVDKLLEILPPQFKQVAKTQPQALSQAFLLRRLVDDALKAGLDKKSPYKEQLEFTRMQVLYQAELTDYSDHIPIGLEDQQQYYKNNPDLYKQAKVRVIYLAFSSTPDKPGPDGKKPLSEAEAKTKIEELRKQIVGGADFGKLARENSDDKASAAKDGDFGIIKRSSPYPQPVKDAVFALKQGEVSQPVKQPAGFYLIRVDESTVIPFEQVSNEIFQQTKQQRFNEYMKNLQSQFTVKVENPAYFAPQPPPAQLQQVR